MVNGITMHEAVASLADAECALARHLDNFNIPGLIDSPGEQTHYLEDLFNAMCTVICIDAESTEQYDLVAALGCDQVCGDGFDLPSDDFPMSLEYDGMYGASDYAIEESAQREAMYESSLGY